MFLKWIFSRLWCFENNGSQLKNNVLYFTTNKFCACCNDVNIMLKENVKHVFTNFQIMNKSKNYSNICVASNFTKTSGQMKICIQGFPTNVFTMGKSENRCCLSIVLEFFMTFFITIRFLKPYGLEAFLRQSLKLRNFSPRPTLFLSLLILPVSKVRIFWSYSFSSTYTQF